MAWDAATQQRFDTLRHRELAGVLSAEERHELDGLLATLDAEEARSLGPAIARLDQEADQQERQLAALQIRNEDLAALVRQHEQLLTEAKGWLASFEQRRLVLQDRYARLAGAALPTKPGR
jgi:hypothetical protein